MANLNNFNFNQKYRTNYFESFTDYDACVNDKNGNYLHI